MATAVTAEAERAPRFVAGTYPTTSLASDFAGWLDTETNLVYLYGRDVAEVARVVAWLNQNPARVNWYTPLPLPGASALFTEVEDDA